MKQTAWKWIDENQKHLSEMADKIWGYAELGLWETRSSKLISDELEKNGFKVRRGIAGMTTAFVAEWGKGQPCIGIQGEFDALPGISQKSLNPEGAIISRSCGSRLRPQYPRS